MNAFTSTRTELAAVVRAVGAAFNRVPESSRPDVAWSEVDDLLEAGIVSGDRAQAMAAIEEWKQRHLDLFAGPRS